MDITLNPGEKIDVGGRTALSGGATGTTPTLGSADVNGGTVQILAGPNEKIEAFIGQVPAFTCELSADGTVTTTFHGAVKGWEFINLTPSPPADPNRIP